MLARVLRYSPHRPYGESERQMANEYTAAQIRTGNRRLLKLAGILDKADAKHRAKGEPTYEQDRMVHTCGTPACAAGHAEADPGLRRAGLKVNSYRTFVDFFSIDRAEDDELFGFKGCGKAQTAKQAAKYIRKFVKNRSAS